MEQEINLSKYWCPRKDCKDYGKTGRGNIIIILGESLAGKILDLGSESAECGICDYSLNIDGKWL
ncbi:Uncharacterised protein [uncultured archaeon]|nr:Uncharacterised protein [uncultured archaeon]